MDAPDPLHAHNRTGAMPPPTRGSPSTDAAPADGAPRPSSVRQLLRQQREMEEKRKFGLAPLAVDAVTHAEISPNVPQTISRAPWYYGATGPTLEHQRKRDGHRDDVLEDHVERVVTTGQAKKFMPGACQNCGSRTHKTSECVRVKKKVGAVYTNKVTGRDVVVESVTSTSGTAAAHGATTTTTEPTYAQKRDRFAGDIKIDLFDLYAKKGEDAEQTTGAQPPASHTVTGDAEEGDPPTKRRRLGRDVFLEQTAQHGGVEVKELPKYLQNLDAMLDGSIYFDPKTGSMRGNPNTQDPTRLFQGDMARAQTGWHDAYLETQHRFITGESKSFVDFDFDDALRQRREDEAKAKQAQSEKAHRLESAHELLVRSLYGDATPTAATTAEASLAPKKAALTALASDAMASGVSATASTNAEEVASSRVARLTAEWNACVADGQTQRHGHTSVFGSFFDIPTGKWGYACCRRLGKDAPPCG